MKTRKRRILLVVMALLLVAAVYLMLYIHQLYKLNVEHGRVCEKVSDLPVACTRYVETHCAPLDDPEVGNAWVLRYDVDDDGDDELIVDSGDLGRGAANSDWAIWKKISSDKYQCLGKFFCAQFFFIPPWTIYGMPYIWCYYDGLTELVPWKNGRYDGEGGSELR